MTIYTDRFTGQNISGVIPYSSYDLNNGSVQLLWTNQNGTQALPVNVAANLFVANIVDFLSTADNTNFIYLPDASLMPIGASFTLNSRFTTSSARPFIVKVFGGTNVINDTNAPGYVGFSYLFYTKDQNNSATTTWGASYSELQV